MNTGMLNGFAGVQNTLSQGFFGVTGAINAGVNTLSGQMFNMAADQAMCCCQTQREIERGFADTNYNLATQSCETRRAVVDATRDILENQNVNTRSILDFLTQDKIAALTAENQSLKLAASQAVQNNYLVEQLSPKCPVPAYVVCNPYTGQYGYNYSTPTCGAF